MVASREAFVRDMMILTSLGRICRILSRIESVADVLTCPHGVGLLRRIQIVVIGPGRRRWDHLVSLASAKGFPSNPQEARSEPCTVVAVTPEAAAASLRDTPAARVLGLHAALPVQPTRDCS